MVKLGRLYRVHVTLYRNRWSSSSLFVIVSQSSLSLLIMSPLLPTAREGNVFRSFCLFAGRRFPSPIAPAVLEVDSLWREGGTRQKVTSYTNHLVLTSSDATAAIGTYPTRKHFCVMLLMFKPFEPYYNGKYIPHASHTSLFHGVLS